MTKPAYVLQTTVSVRICVPVNNCDNKTLTDETYDESDDNLDEYSDESYSEY